MDAIKHWIKNSGLYNKWEAYSNHIDTEDVFLVSFPKSGNTWTRFMITGLYLWELGEGRTCPNYFNIHTWVKDIHLEKIPKRVYFSTLPRIIKSHRGFTPNYTRAVLVVRDVRDVMISWFKFLNRNKEVHKSFDEFIRNPYFGVQAWVRHTDSWMASPTNRNKKLHFVRYEDFIVNPKGCLQNMLEFLNVDFPEEAIDWTIQQSSKEKIKHLEATFGRARTSKVPFLRKGEAQQWKTEMSPECLQYIVDVAGKTLQSCGYSL